ncbi:MAG: Uma2 family endonuclease [Anaerolineae bacterium]|nr:Uma2 family endonuclease [Anaerolineae bacterium]NUQ06210.1 Uma2 family endonuclease [Anaerolineae bacterium]
MTTREAPISIDQFEAFLARPENRDRRFELIDGEISEKTMPTREHGIISAKFVHLMMVYFEAHPEREAQVAVEARHRPTGDAGNDRIPDVSVVLGKRPIETYGTADYLPDICIEVQSPDDSLRMMREKARFYIANGAKYAVNVLPAQRAIETYAADGSEALLTGDDVLSFGDLLPGFAVPVRRFFPDTV